MTSHDTRHFERIDDRGRFVEVIAEGTWEAVIHGQMKAGAVMGNHYHEYTTVYFYLITGRAGIDVVNVGDGARRRIDLASGQGIFLQPNEAHAIRFQEASTFILTKSHRHDEANPDTHEFFVDP